MNKYELLETIGEGAYGVVIKARVKDTGALVAIKRFKESEEEHIVQKTSMREVKVLRALRDQPYIVSMLEAFRRKGRLYLVFDYIGKNVLEVLEERPNGLSEPEVRRMVYTMLLALHTCHSNGIIHRDIKPENLLVWTDGTLRLCDFGFARFVSEGAKDLTDYVATRWYRSPELLLGTSDYGLPADLWAVGCIMAEMIDGQPLFPAESEFDQLKIIQKGLGPLTSLQYDIFSRTPRFSSHSLNPQGGAVQSEHIIERKFESRISKAAMQLLKSLVNVDPARRPTVLQALHAPWFDGLEKQYCPPSVVLSPTSAAAHATAAHAARRPTPPSTPTFDGSAHQQGQQPPRRETSHATGSQAVGSVDDGGRIPALNSGRPGTPSSGQPSASRVGSVVMPDIKLGAPPAQPVMGGGQSKPVRERQQTLLANATATKQPGAVVAGGVTSYATAPRTGSGNANKPRVGPYGAPTTSSVAGGGTGSGQPSAQQMMPPRAQVPHRGDEDVSGGGGGGGSGSGGGGGGGGGRVGSGGPSAPTNKTLPKLHAQLPPQYHGVQPQLVNGGAPPQALGGRPYSRGQQSFA